jgi:hypothetical protein
MAVIDDPTISAATGGGSPSEIYLLFILGLCKEYFKAVSTLEPKAIDASTAALISFVPARTIRERLWREYVEKKEAFKGQAAAATLSASVYIVGEVISELSELLEFTAEGHGALL